MNDTAVERAARHWWTLYTSPSTTRLQMALASEAIGAALGSGVALRMPPDDFEHEPLPTDTFASEQEFAGGAPVTPPPPVVPVTNGGVSAFRGAAMQQPTTAGIWQVGAVHEQGHKPLKAGQRGGLFCPTKLGEDAGGKGVWCQFRV